MATLMPITAGRFVGHYDPDTDIAWIRFDAYDGSLAVSSEEPWGLEERDPDTGDVVALEIWRARQTFPAGFLKLLPRPQPSRDIAEGSAVVEECLAWLEAHYWDQPFWMERDLVWALQKNLGSRLHNDAHGAQVVHNLRTAVGHVDLAIVRNGVPLVAVECKYEPARSRPDFAASRLEQAVVFWDRAGVLEDVRRAVRVVAAGDVAVAYAVFLDEGGRFRQREPPPISRWLDWHSDRGTVSVLKTRIDPSNVRAAMEWMSRSGQTSNEPARLSPSDVASALDNLHGRDREVIEHRLEGATQAAIANTLGISTARVAQIEQRAKGTLIELGISPESVGLPPRGRRGRPRSS